MSNLIRNSIVTYVVHAELKPTIMAIAKLEHKARQVRKGEA